MKKLLFLFLAHAAMLEISAQTRFQKDFDFYWKTVNENFAYFHTQKTNWQKVKEIYQPRVDSITTTDSFIHLLETVNHELYNGHVFLNTHRPASMRSIPSGADLKVSLVGSKYLVTELRAGFGAESSGIRVGMQVIRVNDIWIEDAVRVLLPKSVTKYDTRMYEYAANVLLAGTHNTQRSITVLDTGKQKTFFPDAKPNRTEEHRTELLRHSLLPGNIGYIDILNSLGDRDLVAGFDAAVDSLAGSIGLIIDLRETPGGGNTTIARAILGRFVTREQPYQKHIYTIEGKETGIRRATLELVSPRAPVYKKPIVILVGYWTGSMGEGIAIAFDGMKRAKVAGTKMAGLLGEIYTFRMPGTNIPFSFPAVQLQHINGTARESFIPPFLVKDHSNAINFAKNLLGK